MSTNNLSRLLTALGEARKDRVAAYEQYATHRAFEDQLRLQLEAELHSSGLKSAKGEDFSASIVSKPTVIVRHEASVIEWLKNSPDIESDLYIGIKPTEFQTLAKALLKNGSELIPGTDIEMHENLSIKSVKKG